jgi:vitamin B12 transporter
VDLITLARTLVAGRLTTKHQGSRFYALTINPPCNRRGVWGSGGFDLGEFSTSIVERIEVLPGGGSTLYGSDAIGGIINIVTSRPASDKLTFKTQLEVGNLGYSKMGINVSKVDGKIAWSVGYDRIQAANNYNYSIPEANVSGTRTNNDATYNNLRVRADVDVSDRTKLNFTTIYLSKN